MDIDDTEDENIHRRETVNGATTNAINDMPDEPIEMPKNLWTVNKRVDGVEGMKRIFKDSLDMNQAFGEVPDVHDIPCRTGATSFPNPKCSASENTVENDEVIEQTQFTDETVNENSNEVSTLNTMSGVALKKPANAEQANGEQRKEIVLSTHEARKQSFIYMKQTQTGIDTDKAAFDGFFCEADADVERLCCFYCDKELEVSSIMKGGEVYAELINHSKSCKRLPNKAEDSET